MKTQDSRETGADAPTPHEDGCRTQGESPPNDSVPRDTEQDCASTTRVKRIGLAALILSAGILCSRLLGYVREAVIAYQAGAGSETDAYNAAFMLPDLMNHFLAGGTLSITFIPLFAGYLAKGHPDRANRLFSLIATTMGALVLGAILICGVFTHEMVRMLFPGFDAWQVAQTVEMTRIILPGQFFHYLGGLMMAVLMARGQFLPSALAPLIYNAFIILGGIILGASMGMKGFAIGALVGAMAGPFLLPLIFVRARISYRPVFGFGDVDFRKYILLTLPLMLGVSLTTVDEWVGRFIGSTMEAGSISWLNYARRLVLVPIAIVGQAAGQAALPYLSQLSARGEFLTAAETLHKTLRNVIILSLVLVGFFVALSEPMVALVYERGAFGSEDTAKTAAILKIFSISIVFWTIQMVSVRAFYAAQNTLTPMIATTIVTVLSLPVYGVLSTMYGLRGLAMASCIGMAMQAASIILLYRRKNVHLQPMRLLRAFVPGLMLGLAAWGGSRLGLWLSSWVSFEAATVKALWTLAVSGFLGTSLCAMLAWFVVPNELRGFIARLRHKLRRRSG
ncbi:MAG: murein biosynthesis integral membrane protein MurJ [Proteobacteria bacterium]|nr:murein biosynthesis integral membrane protein MurJ [Pseudomonadota bacterium]